MSQIVPFGSQPAAAACRPYKPGNAETCIMPGFTGLALDATAVPLAYFSTRRATLAGPKTWVIVSVVALPPASAANDTSLNAS